MVGRVSRKVRIVAEFEVEFEPAEFEVSSELEREEGLEASRELERDRDLDTGYCHIAPLSPLHKVGAPTPFLSPHTHCHPAQSGYINSISSFFPGRP